MTLKRTAFQFDIAGPQAEAGIQASKAAFDAVAEADQEGGSPNHGTIVCQLLRVGGGLRIRGQFLPHQYAAQVADVFIKFRDALIEDEVKRAPMLLHEEPK
jgi:hypothetical protein